MYFPYTSPYVRIFYEVSFYLQFDTYLLLAAILSF